ncbi:MAG: hypothetical protein ACM31C_11510, partial [Acidobacteriota bacterium]
SSRAAQPFVDTPPPANQCPLSVTGCDLVSTMIGDEKKLPFFPRIIQWATSGAGREAEEK